MTKISLSFLLCYSVLSLQVFTFSRFCCAKKISEEHPLKYPDFTSNNYQRKVVLDVSEKVVSADCTNRPSVIINGSFPGPELRFKAGETVKITVRNHLSDRNTTMHFHGLSQFGSPFSDGTEKISQFAIPANGSYDYVFRLDEPGTYLYHAHVGLHLATCHGAFIVEDANPPPFKYDEELVLLFADYYHAPDRQITDGLEAAPFKWLGEPQNLVVNGEALGTCDEPSAVHGCTIGCHHHVLTVKPNRTYRVRVIGITVLTYVYFGIEDHHDLSVIEADGGYVQPASTKHMQLHSGQRYSFLLKTKSVAELKKLGSRKDFWGRLETRWRPIRDQGAFVLRYDTDHHSLSHPKNNENKSMDLSLAPLPNVANFEKLVPLPHEGEIWLTEEFRPLNKNQVAPTRSQVTRRITIKGQQIKASDGHISWFVNDRKYVETQPNVPYLVKAYTKQLKPNYEESEKHNGFDQSLGAYLVKLDDVVEFVIINQASQAGVAEAHPWHLHGKKFYVIAHGTGEFTEAKLAESEARFKNTHILRDTQVLFSSKEGASYSNTTVPANSVTGWLVIRLRADDPGAFLFHCHTQPHAAMGMGAVILMGIDKLPPLPPGYLNNFIDPPGAGTNYIKAPGNHPIDINDKTVKRKEKRNLTIKHRLTVR